MQKWISLIGLLIVFSACNSKKDSADFVINGQIDNLPDQPIYLEQLFFSSQRGPEILDTAITRKGRFSLRATSSTEGLYRLRLEKDRAVFVFINDQPTINFTANINTLSMKSAMVNTPANQLLQKFIAESDARLTALYNKGNELNANNNKKTADSLYQAAVKSYDLQVAEFQQYILRYIDTVKHPVMALFALGYTSRFDPALLQAPVAALPKRFPDNTMVADVVKQFTQSLQEARPSNDTKGGVPDVGAVAPDINMPDTEGNSFSLSSLRGKYVLVDFWASWCGPCRDENPNVVKAYQRFKNKNFTILGVSLDKNKVAWLEAIKEDRLDWKHISDLKQWNSAVVASYHIEGIPHNVLLDPQGKILAIGLRGEELEKKLAEVVK